MTDAATFLADRGVSFSTVTMPTAGVDFRAIDIDAYFREHYGFGADVVCKSLILSAEGTHVMAVLPVAAKLNIVEVARAIGKKKGTLVSPDAATALTGLTVGAIGPLALRTPMPVVIDAAVMQLPRVAVSAGSPGEQLVLHPEDLAAVTEATVRDIQKR